MRRWALSALFTVVAAVPALAQVQTVGDVSFAVPEGWSYKAAANGGVMFLQKDQVFWIISVHPPRPSSGDPIADYKAAWRGEILPMPDFQNSLPGYNPYDMGKSLGYPGKEYSGNSDSGKMFVRLYTLQAGKMVVPVSVVTVNRQVLDVMAHMINAVVDSVRVAPLKASPIRNSLTMTDLTGDWRSGMAMSKSYYDRYNGSYVGSTQTFYGATYHVGGNGSFTYRLDGMLNNQPVHDLDQGTVELGGEFVSFKGRTHTRRFRFLNLQTAIDGSTVMMLLPAEADPAQVNIAARQEQWEKLKPDSH